ncbi:MAG TPA: hemerythrin domain-containing protein [Acidimicrobiales bacterium]|nr:hemerythrin domain-containing protein [Acidimicrobiales bacterium]
MTITTHPSTPELRLVTHDLYRDIHKAIRAELFAVTEEAGRLDPAERDGRAALAAHVEAVVALLASHAEHEDAGIQPAIEAHLPALAEQIAGDHERLEARMVDLTELALVSVDAPTSEQRGAVHRLYVELASFSGVYLAHQDLEERLVMPALEAAIGPDAVIALHQQLVGSIPPEEMAQSLALMLPAMNRRDRADLLGGMQADAPAEVFQAVWGLARSVLVPADHAAVAGDLGLA